jgi:hypothetical protein
MLPGLAQAGIFDMVDQVTFAYLNIIAIGPIFLFLR